MDMDVKGSYTAQTFRGRIAKLTSKFIGSAHALIPGALLMSLCAVASAQSLPVVGTLSLGSAQTGQVTFTGTPGEYVTITLQEGTGDSYISGIQATLTAPDGSTLNGTSVMDYQEPTYSFVCENGPCYGNSIINLGPLPTYSQGTTYTVTIQTSGSSGNLNYTITTPLVNSNPLVVNAAAVDEYIGLPGQGMLIPVTLTAGRDYIFTISEVDRNMPIIEADILNSNGTVVQGAGMVASCAAPCTIGTLNAYSGSEGDGVGVGTTGQYTVHIYQLTQTSGANAYPPLDDDFYLQIATN